MTKRELNILVENLIWIKDNVPMSFESQNVIADASNVIYHNIDKIKEEES